MELIRLLIPGFESRSLYIGSCLKLLPEGSALIKIEGGSHVVYIEKQLYRDFQKRLIDFLYA